MIKSKLGFFEMSGEVFFAEAAHFGHACFRDTPEVLDAVDMSLAVGEDLPGVPDPVMLLASDIHQSVTSLPFVGIDGGVFGRESLCYWGERGCGAVLHDLGEDLLATLFHAEDDGLAVGSPSTPSLHAAGAEVGLVHLDLAGAKGGFRLRHDGYPRPHEGEDAVDRVAVEAAQTSYLRGGKVGAEEPQNLAEFALRKVRLSHVLVSHYVNTSRKQRHVNLI